MQKPVMVRVERVWGRGIFRVVFKLKGPRHFRELYRKIDSGWWTGDKFLVGIYSSPLRKASQEFATALNLCHQKGEQ